MSYIDSHEHEIVGLFGHLPVYRPLHDIAGSEQPYDDDFSCSPGQLVLGGGSGEHPGLVLLSAESAVAQFAINNEEFELSDDQANALYQKYLSRKQPFHFAQWSSSDHHRFYQMCSDGALPNNYNPDGKMHFEAWLHSGFGEFIYYAMPTFAGELVEQLRLHQPKPSHIYYNNIMVIPPGMPVYANGGNAFFRV